MAKVVLDSIILWEIFLSLAQGFGVGKKKPSRTF